MSNHQTHQKKDQKGGCLAPEQVYDETRKLNQTKSSVSGEMTLPLRKGNAVNCSGNQSWRAKDLAGLGSELNAKTKSSSSKYRC